MIWNRNNWGMLLFKLITGCFLVAATLANAETISTDPTPRYITYYNSDDSPLSSALDTPYTHIVLAFVTATVDEHKCIKLHTNPRLELAWGDVAKLQRYGKKMMISFGGGGMQSDDYAPLAGRELELAKLLADFVRSKKLDGIGIDYEASDTFHASRPESVIEGREFLIALTKALRTELPAPRYLLSHAPQPPYLSASWHGGAYLDILKAVGNHIDWIVVQYYNNPGFDDSITKHVVGNIESPYSTSYRGLTAKDGKLHWPARKIVIGKPVHKTNVRSGHIKPKVIIEKIIKPLQKTYGQAFGGLMGWQYDSHGNDHPAWNTVVGQALLHPLKIRR